MGKVFLTASGKGGTGKTMFAANLAATYALQGHSVLVLDMDMGLRNADLYFGLENSMVYDAYDVMTGRCRIRQALVRDRRFRNLYVMGASPEKEKGDLTPLHSRILTEKLREKFDYIIIDGPSGIDDGLVIAAAGADIAVIVATAEYASLRDADQTALELQKLGISKRYMVLNKVVAELMNKGYVPKLRDILSGRHPEVIGIIQQDQNINISTNVGIPIVLKPDTYISRNFIGIADRLAKA